MDTKPKKNGSLESFDNMKSLFTNKIIENVENQDEEDVPDTTIRDNSDIDLDDKENIKTWEGQEKKILIPMFLMLKNIYEMQLMKLMTTLILSIETLQIVLLIRYQIIKQTIMIVNLLGNFYRLLFVLLLVFQ